MHELTNLLPLDRTKKLSQEYLVRIAVIALALLTLLVLIHSALLAPSYIYLSEELATRKAHLEGIASSFASSKEETTQSRLVALSAHSEALLSLVNASKASAAVRSVLSVPRGGVAISGVALTFAESGGGIVRISGIAPTRESLRNYHAQLSALPGISKADLPLSVYAAESDLPFLITLTGTFTP
jgi:hypothetical protein